MARKNKNPDMPAPVSRIARKGADIEARALERKEKSEVTAIISHDDGTREDARQNSEVAHAAGNVRRTQTVRTPGAAFGLRPGWQRFTVVARKPCIDALKARAAAEGRTIKDVMDDMMSSYLNINQ